MMLRSVTLVGAKALPSIGIVNRCAIESVTAVPLKALKATIRRSLHIHKLLLEAHLHGNVAEVLRLSALRVQILFRFLFL